MKKILFPTQEQWPALCHRPSFDSQELIDAVRQILMVVKHEGDSAIRNYSLKFDGTTIEDIWVSVSEFEEAELRVSQPLKEAIQLAMQNITTFHESQIEKSVKITTTPGVDCWRRSIAIERVGLYIPSGSAPLFSTILMLGIPAKIAGCKDIILCTPPNKEGKIEPAILYTAKLVGITKVAKIGGAQAIAAMAFGTASIQRVHKIFGPGNQYVTKAKELVQQYGVAIDMPAGPSEVLVIADKTCVPAFVAADLLAQAEHGPDSQVVVLSDNESIIDAILAELDIQTQLLPRKNIVEKALQNSFAMICQNMDECFAFSNLYAPEHLIVAADEALIYENRIINAGSVFLGNYSCESAGDYASGTNHTLPTNGYASSYSGVSVDSFVKKITFQNLSPLGLENIGPAIELMAEAEQLLAHKNAVSIRLKTINNV
jgi:histidinol dehydrogenase